MRNYITFGRNDKITWKELGVEEASSPDQARAKARAADEEWEHYSATTLRGWAPATPTDRTVTTWEEINPDQLTIDDDADDDEIDERERRLAESTAALNRGVE